MLGKHIASDKGFTLIELLIVVIIIAIRRPLHSLLFWGSCPGSEHCRLHPGEKRLDGGRARASKAALQRILLRTCGRSTQHHWVVSVSTG